MIHTGIAESMSLLLAVIWNMPHMLLSARWTDHFQDVRARQPGPERGCRAPPPDGLFKRKYPGYQN